MGRKGKIKPKNAKFQRIARRYKVKVKVLESASCYDKPRQHINKQKRYFADIGTYSQSYGLSSIHIWM